MSSLHISQGTFRLSDTRTLTIADLTIRAGESWAFVGTNGSGKSALAARWRESFPFSKANAGAISRA